MADIKLFQFLGEIPYLHPRKLPPGSALKAQNCTVLGGVLRALKESVTAHTPVLTDSKTIYDYNPKDGTRQWIEFPTDTDVVKWPLGDDDHDRIIYSDSAFPLGPRIVDNVDIGTDGGAVGTYRELGIPAPPAGPIATVVGTADAEDIPDVRYYAVTFVNQWGQEGPPSPVSNQVEVDAGQYVALTGLPTVPTTPVGAQYNITARRIYRTNVGTGGNTSYQYVAEVQTVAGVDYTAATVTNGSPQTIVTFSSDTTLEAGDTVNVHGTFGLQGAAKTVAGVTYGATSTILNVTAHGLSTGDQVVLSASGFPTELKGLKSLITEGVDVDHFTLDVLAGVDTQGYTAYTSGGTAQESFGLDLLVDKDYQIISMPDVRTVYIDIDSSDELSLHASGVLKLTKTSGASFNDSQLGNQLGEILSTVAYDPPNVKTHGIVTHPSGFLVGFYNNVIAFCEVGAPHAWPIEYRQATEADIVGLGVFGNYVLVTTKEQPVLLFGNNPASMVPVKLPLEQSCSSKRGMVDFGLGVVYPSPDGLIYITQGKPVNLTSNLFKKEDWQALDPSTFLAFNWEGQYLCFFGDGSAAMNSFVIEPSRPEVGVQFFPDWAIAGAKNLEEDTLYLNIGNSIKKWDSGTSYRTMKWISREVELTYPRSFGWIQVHADNYPVTVRLIGDSDYRQEVLVQSDEPQRVPAGFKAKKWKLDIAAKYNISSIALAQTIKDLAAGVE